MKTMITTLLAAILSMSAANAESGKGTTSENKLGASLSTKSHPSTLAVLEENMKLKKTLASLVEEQESLQSTLAYQHMMQQMFDKIDAEKHAEMKAELDYTRMMAAMLLQLHGK